MNGLVPPDQLHWNEDAKVYTLLSQKEMDTLIEACFRTGLTKEKDIVKVVHEYEKVRSGQLLFDQFLSGNIGVYEFSEDGSPIFELIRSESVREVSFESILGGFDVRNENERLIGGRTVRCEGDLKFDVFSFYSSVVDFCSKWGVDILNGENPEEEAILRCDPEFLSEIKRRSWRVVEVEKDGSLTKIRIMFTGNWLRTDHRSP